LADRPGGDRIDDAVVGGPAVVVAASARGFRPVARFYGYRHELAAAGVAADVVDARLPRLGELTVERDDWAAPMRQVEPARSSGSALAGRHRLEICDCWCCRTQEAFVQRGMIAG
jgi:hypothetical protein